MRLKQLIIAGVLLLTTLISCSKKDEDKTPAFKIEGTWTGKYSVLSEPYNNYYSFKVKPGGILELLDAAQQKAGEGTWIFDGQFFEGTYSRLAPGSGTFSVLSTINLETGKLSGTWGLDMKQYGGGYWYMNKIS